MIPRRLRQLLQERFTFRVFFIVYLFIAAMALGLNTFYYQWQRQMLEKEIIHDGRLLAQVVAHGVVLGVFAENAEQLKPAMDAVTEQPGVEQVSVFSHQGRLLGQSRRKPAEAHVFPEDRFLPSFSAKAAALQTDFYEEEERRFLFWAPVHLNIYASEDALYFTGLPVEKEDVIGFVQVAMHKQRLEQSFRELISHTLFTTAFILLVGLLITLLIAREVSRPLNRLIERLGQQGIETGGSGQISALSGTFDRLVAQLGQAFETINSMKEDLELRVLQRTGELNAANSELQERQAHLEEANARLEEVNRELAQTLHQLRETQAQMIQSEKMVALGQLVAGVAHEINNTTNFITGALPSLGRMLGELREVLDRCHRLDRRATKKVLASQIKELEVLKEEIDYEKTVAGLEVLMANIREGARRTTQIVRDLKNFARPGAAEWKPVDIHQSIDSTLTLAHSEYKHRIEIVKEYQEGLPLVPCSPTQLNQVFMNLLLNAMQAVEGRGQIRIRTWADGKLLHVAIKDSGSGIPEKIRSRIFEPFFTTKPVGRGTGLGLSISYGIIKKHRGEITVHSEPGKGTEFEITLPLAGRGEPDPE